MDNWAYRWMDSQIEGEADETKHMYNKIAVVVDKCLENFWFYIRFKHLFPYYQQMSIRHPELYMKFNA